MTKIRVLEEAIINKIAAGEIVERPFSIIKELVDNSIDADATKIFIAIEAGGRNFISVLDNGCGMSAEDCRLSVTRHATSKIQKIADLSSIMTMGFRGEALAAIASVSHFEITTSQSDEQAGFRIVFDNNKKISEEKLGFAAGTRVVVRNLFQNIPARLKFLKAINVEVSKIYDYIVAVSLSYLKIEFKLIVDKKSILNLPSRQNLSQRMLDCFGTKIVENLIFVKHQESYLKFYGAISLPNFCRVNKKFQFEYINSRHVFSKQIQQAIYKSYESLLPKQMHPFYLLKLDISPEDVDVNVHPAKTEVKLKNPVLIKTILIENLQQQLRNSSRDKYQVSANKINIPSNYYQQKVTLNSNIVKEELLPINQTKRNIVLSVSSNLVSPQDESKIIKENYQNFQKPQPLNKQEDKSLILQKDNFKILGIFKKYLIAIIEDRLATIDVHAAHERIRYEQIKQEYYSTQNKLESYLLLQPFFLSFSTKETILLESYKDLLFAMGFEIEYFGNHDFSIKAIPSILKNSKQQTETVQNFISELLENLKNFNNKNSLQDFVLDHLKKMACHSSLRGERDVAKMSSGDAEKLIKELYTSEVAIYCPHGRPVIIFQEEKDFDKLFNRT